MTAETRACPLKRCDKQMVLVEEGNFNGVEIRYWLCPCGKEYRETVPAHEEPALDLGV